MATAADTEYMSEIELGKPYEDGTTNFQGIATQICFDMGGDTRVYLEAQASESNKKAEGAWFSETRLR